MLHKRLFLLCLSLFLVSGDQCSLEEYEDWEDSISPGTIKTLIPAQPFGLPRIKAVSPEKCREIKLMCLKYRLCKRHCGIQLEKTLEGKFRDVNPCRLVIPACKGIDLDEYTRILGFKEEQPFNF